MKSKESAKVAEKQRTQMKNSRLDHSISKSSQMKALPSTTMSDRYLWILSVSSIDIDRYSWVILDSACGLSLIDTRTNSGLYTVL
jgi:hypothetical protein